jgi:excisionase family DNA binding protein
VATDPRFLTLTDVAEVLNVSAAQVYALVRSGELISLKVGGRGQYRVERDDLEAYIARMKARTAEFITEHPLTRDEPDQPEDPDESDQPD